MPIVITGPSSATTFGLTLNPSTAPIDLNDGDLYRLMTIDFPEPPLKTLYVSSFDTEGSLPVSEHGYENREITVGLMVFAGSASSLLTMLSVLKEAQGQINAEQKGELEVTFPDGTAVIFDLVQASGAEALERGHGFVQQNRVEVTLTFTAKPFWRAMEVDLGTFSETTLPCLTAVLPEIAGDVPALGRMVVTDLSGNDQWMVKWGRQSRFYDAAATAALFYQAEALTPLGGAATAVGATGASGSGSNVVRQGTLVPAMQGMLSTQAVAGGAHLTHVGSFDVLARVYMPTSNTGAVSLALEWGQGDFRQRVANDPVDFDAGHSREGQFVIARLGQVHIAEGSTRWEGRLIASSTVSDDDLDVDWLALVPITEGSGELSALQLAPTPSAFSARDEFDQAAGVLNGKTAALGGTWVGSGDSDDFSVTAQHTAQRTAVSDANVYSGRFAILGSATFTNVVVQADVMANNQTTNTYQAVAARYVDANNWFFAYFDPVGNIQTITNVAGVKGTFGFDTYQYIPGTWVTIRLFMTASGKFYFWVYPAGGSPGEPNIAGSSSLFATGGALASGKVGIYDMHVSATAQTRDYDNFVVWVPDTDAAVYAAQSLELTHERARREDATGAVWSRVSNVEGDYLRLAPAGREGRVNRLLVKGSRNDPATMDDPGIDDLEVQVFATPRGVSIPSP